MSIYAISDIHGCFDEFMELLGKIQFNPAHDTLYILGDIIDRGERPIDCLKYVMSAENIYFLLGNHEQLMLDYFSGADRFTWTMNGHQETIRQFMRLPNHEREEILTYFSNIPLYMIINAGGIDYFLSHAGVNVANPVHQQDPHDLLWIRYNFIRHKALSDYICIFGHTPTPRLHGNSDSSVWYDTINKDKICIDCGCVYGGSLAAIRLDDGKTLYVEKHNRHKIKRYRFKGIFGLS